MTHDNEVKELIDRIYAELLIELVRKSHPDFYDAKEKIAEEINRLKTEVNELGEKTKLAEKASATYTKLKKKYGIAWEDDYDIFDLDTSIAYSLIKFDNLLNLYSLYILPNRYLNKYIEQFRVSRDDIAHKTNDEIIFNDEAYNQFTSDMSTFLSLLKDLYNIVLYPTKDEYNKHKTDNSSYSRNSSFSGNNTPKNSSQSNGNTGHNTATPDGTYSYSFKKDNTTSSKNTSNSASSSYGYQTHTNNTQYTNNNNSSYSNHSYGNTYSSATDSKTYNSSNNRGNAPQNNKKPFKNEYTYEWSDVDNKRTKKPKIKNKRYPKIPRAYNKILYIVSLVSYIAFCSLKLLICVNTTVYDNKLSLSPYIIATNQNEFGNINHITAGILGALISLVFIHSVLEHGIFKKRKPHQVFVYFTAVIISFVIGNFFPLIDQAINLFVTVINWLFLVLNVWFWGYIDTWRTFILMALVLIIAGSIIYPSRRAKPQKTNNR